MLNKQYTQYTEEREERLKGMKSKVKSSVKSKASFTVDPEVLYEIDKLRGLATRSAFANHVLKLGIKTYRTLQKEGKAPTLPVTLETDEETTAQRPES